MFRQFLTCVGQKRFAASKSWMPAAITMAVVFCASPRTPSSVEVPRSTERVVQWTVDESGDFLLDTGGVPYEFDGVVNAFFGATGDIVAGEEGRRAVVAFGGDRRLIWTSGESGRSPGNFEVLSSVTRGPGDVIIAADEHRDRITLFNAVGDMVRTVDIDLEVPALVLKRALGFADGSFAVVTEEDAGEWSDDGVRRGASAYFRVDSAGAVLNDLGTFPGEERFFTSAPRVVGSLPFGRRTVAATDGESLFVADGTSFAVHTVHRGGSRTSTIDVGGVSEARVSAADIREHKRLLLRHAVPPELMPIMANHLDRIEFPEFYPAHRNLLVDDGGLVWLEEYPARATASIRWHVVDRTGQRIARVEASPRLRIVAVADRRVLAVTALPSGKERIAVHALSRWER